METGYKVGDIMTPVAISVGPKTSLRECAEMMSKKKIGSLLVKDDIKLLGIFTEQDIIRKAVMDDKLPSEITAEEIMETKVVDIHPDQDISEAVEMMRNNNVRHLPVVYDERVVGFVTLKDILKIQPELFETIGERLVLGKEKDLLQE